MKLTEFLIKSDVSILDNKAEQVIELPRLSKLFKTKFEVTIKNLTNREMDTARKEASKPAKKGTNIELDTDIYNAAVVRFGTYDEDGNRFFTNQELMDKFKVFTPDDLIKKLLYPGEIAYLSAEIADVSGYNVDSVKVSEDDIVKEIKN